MTTLILGLIIFLGVHSVRIFAEDWRTGMRARLGQNAWKGVYSVFSVLGFTFIVWGYGEAQLQPVVLWMPPLWTRHLASAITLLAFVLLVAAYVPGNAVKAKLHHPMILGVKAWALAHLLANGRLAAVLLFGAFLVWSVLCYRAARQRDRVEQTSYAAGRALPTVITVALGLAAWAGFAWWAHAAWIGVRPFG